MQGHYDLEEESLRKSEITAASRRECKTHSFQCPQLRTCELITTVPDKHTWRCLNINQIVEPRSDFQTFSVVELLYCCTGMEDMKTMSR